MNKTPCGHTCTGGTCFPCMDDEKPEEIFLCSCCVDVVVENEGDICEGCLEDIHADGKCEPATCPYCQKERDRAEYLMEREGI